MNRDLFPSLQAQGWPHQRGLATRSHLRWPIVKMSFLRLQFVICSMFVFSGCNEIAQTDNICGYRYHEMSRKCIIDNFPSGSSDTTLSSYMRAANFEYIEITHNNDNKISVWHRQDDYEKGPREILVIALIRKNKIEKVNFHRWDNQNWRPEGRPTSPFEKCVVLKMGCRRYLDG